MKILAVWNKFSRKKGSALDRVIAECGGTGQNGFTDMIRRSCPQAQLKRSWESIRVCVAEEKDRMALQVKNPNFEITMKTNDEVENNNAELNDANVLAQRTRAFLENARKSMLLTNTLREKVDPTMEDNPSVWLVFMFPTTTMTTRKHFLAPPQRGRKPRQGGNALVCLSGMCRFVIQPKLVSGSFFFLVG